jgi:hypothetical protein
VYKVGINPVREKPLTWKQPLLKAEPVGFIGRIGKPVNCEVINYVE